MAGSMMARTSPRLRNSSPIWSPSDCQRNRSGSSRLQERRGRTKVPRLGRASIMPGRQGAQCLSHDGAAHSELRAGSSGSTVSPGWSSPARMRRASRAVMRPCNPLRAGATLIAGRRPIPRLLCRLVRAHPVLDIRSYYMLAFRRHVKGGMMSDRSFTRREFMGAGAALTAGLVAAKGLRPSAHRVIEEARPQFANLTSSSPVRSTSTGGRRRPRERAETAVRRFRQRRRGSTLTSLWSRTITRRLSRKLPLRWVLASPATTLFITTTSRSRRLVPRGG